MGGAPSESEYMLKETFLSFWHTKAMIASIHAPNLNVCHLHANMHRHREKAGRLNLQPGDGLAYDVTSMAAIRAES